MTRDKAIQVAKIHLYRGSLPWELARAIEVLLQERKW